VSTTDDFQKVFSIHVAANCRFLRVGEVPQKGFYHVTFSESITLELFMAQETLLRTDGG
jgi:hypothetical protein